VKNYCKICNGDPELFLKEKVLDKYEVSFFQCIRCGFVQTEEPYWLEESYIRSMNIGDTGIVSRNFYSALMTKQIIKNFLDPKGQFLDYAGGYGIFTRTMRDLGFDFYWEDPYTKNIFSEGFSNQKSSEFFEAITIFECFEHWENPIKEIEFLFSKTETIIFTTNIINVPAPKKWWYYGLDHGQHISFFSQKSLEFIADKYDCKFYSKYGIHILTKKKLNKFKLKAHLFISKLIYLAAGFNSKNSFTSVDHIKLTEKTKALN
jgi:hypothetical protein